MIIGRLQSTSMIHRRRVGEPGWIFITSTRRSHTRIKSSSPP